MSSDKRCAASADGEPSAAAFKRLKVLADGVWWQQPLMIEDTPPHAEDPAQAVANSSGPTDTEIEATPAVAEAVAIEGAEAVAPEAVEAVAPEAVEAVASEAVEAVASKEAEAVASKEAEAAAWAAAVDGAKAVPPEPDPIAPAAGEDSSIFEDAQKPGYSPSAHLRKAPAATEVPSAPSSFDSRLKAAEMEAASVHRRQREKEAAEEQPEVPMTKREAKFLNDLKEALASREVKTRSNLYQKFQHAVSLDADQMAKFKGLATDEERKKFRCEWAAQEVAVIEHSRQHIKDWQRINSQVGQYITIASMAERYGYAVDRESSLRSARSYATKAAAMGGPWVHYDAMAEQLLYLFITTERKEIFSESWRMFETSFPKEAEQLESAAMAEGLEGAGIPDRTSHGETPQVVVTPASKVGAPPVQVTPPRVPAPAPGSSTSGGRGTQSSAGSAKGSTKGKGAKPKAKGKATAGKTATPQVETTRLRTRYINIHTKGEAVLARMREEGGDWEWANSPKLGGLVATDIGNMTKMLKDRSLEDIIFTDNWRGEVMKAKMRSFAEHMRAPIEKAEKSYDVLWKMHLARS